MNKFSIVCVTNSKNPEYIHHVGIYVRNSEPISHMRSEVISNIDAGHTYYTWIKKNGVWTKGALVKKTHDGKFITTDPNHTTSDNLGKLPRCSK